MEESKATEAMNGGGDKKWRKENEYSLYEVVNSMIATIFFPNSNSSEASTPLIHRIKNVFSDNRHILREASRNSGRSVLQWTRKGSPLRALLVISVGTIAMLELTGLLVFMIFIAAATVDAIIISLLMSLAAAGGFLAIFFSCLTAIYVGVLSAAAIVIFTVTVSAIVACLFTAGWIGFFYLVWWGTKTSVGLAKHSLNMTSSAISVYSPSTQDRAPHEPEKID